MSNLKATNKINRIKLRLNKKIIWPLLNPLYIDYQPNYKNSILLAGTERSGTTWMSEVINYKNEYRYIFEPFWPNRVSLCSQFHDQQYIRPDNQDPNFLHVAETILSGKIRNKWTDKYHRRFIANKRLIKDVRVNLFLRWLYNHFSDMPIILMMRHPCAVAVSQLRINWTPDLHKEFLSQDQLMEDFLNPFRNMIESAETRFDKFIIRWCIQNYIPLKQFKENEIHLIFYENFCVDPETEINKLFLYLGKSYDESIHAKLKKPSPVVRSQSAVISGGSLIDNWRAYSDDTHIERAIEILTQFGLNEIYSYDSMPNDHLAHKILAN